MKKLTALLIVLLSLSACSTGPTADQLAATVNAQVASTLAAVPTNTPQPTDTPASTATNTPKPTNTAEPTNTPQPTETLNDSVLLKLISSKVATLGIKDVEIIDVRYEDGAQGARSILHIEAKYTATPFDSAAAGSIVGIVAGLTKQEGNFEPGLFALNIIMRDAKLNPKQTVVGKWRDIIDYGAGRITPDQLITRLTITP